MKSLRARFRVPFFLAVLPAVASSGCEGERATGLAPAKRTGGPSVVYDIERKPLPEVPLPSDTATRIDPESPTGRRLNVSLEAETKQLSKLRAKFNQLDGFGTYAPITVAFDRELDVANVQTRHGNDDFRDDAVFLLNVDRSCQRFGEEVALDLGRGRFPTIVDQHGDAEPSLSDPAGGNRLFPFDPQGTFNQMLFAERNEDANGNGLLDPGEDRDFDGVLDVANLDDPRACDAWDEDTLERDRCVADHLLDWYERETNTLILRPVWPLEQRCTYAVVLTDRLVGSDGRAVQSPLPAINPRDQTDALAALPELLPRYQLSLDDVAFAWSFTTGSQTQVMEALRAGLHGHGPWARLANEFPIESLRVVAPEGESADGDVTPGGCGAMATNFYWYQGINEYPPNMCAYAADNAALGAYVRGTFEAPYFLADKDGRATPSYPDDHDESFDVDAERGTGTYSTTEVTWWCALPKRGLGEGCQPGNPDGKPFCEPFPTTMFSHGYGSSRAEVTAFLGRQAAMGVAACSLDSPGHGGNRLIQEAETSFELGVALGALEKFGLTDFEKTLFAGRDRDLNNDGLADPGGDYYSADAFHTRDMLRQSALEFVQFTRILRRLDGRTGPDGSVLGDFDGNGVPDIGGPENTISAWGISMGGLITGILAGLEQSLDATSPNAGGAGLTDIANRSTVAGLPAAAFMPVMGPFVTGWRTDARGAELPEGELMLAFYVADVTNERRVDFARVSGIEPGDRIELENPRKNEKASVVVSERGTFRVSVPADALDAFERRPLLGAGDEALADPVEVDDPTRFGDPLIVRVYDGDTGSIKAVRIGDDTVEAIDRFYDDTEFQGTRYPAGSTLVAIQQGAGHTRNTPDFRRLFSIIQHALSPADSGVWAQHYFEYPLDQSYDPHARPDRNHVLVVPTAGDMVVPVNTGIATARAAGILGSWRRDESLPAEYGWRELFVPDERWGKSADQYLLDTYTIESIDRLRRHVQRFPKLPRANFDIDNLSDGRAVFPCEEFDCAGDWPDGEEAEVPRPIDVPPLRATRVRADGSLDAMRIPYMNPRGQHGLYNAQKVRPFDADAFGVNITTLFLRSRGQQLDLPPDCHCTAERIPYFYLEGEETWFSDFAPCDNVADLQIRICSAECVEALALRTPAEVMCR